MTDFYYSKKGDYRVKEYTFEIGGKNKSKKQLAGIKTPSFVVQDDMLVPMNGILPLLYFGFLY